jgi:hypothetical protein
MAGQTARLGGNALGNLYTGTFVGMRVVAFFLLPIFLLPFFLGFFLFLKEARAKPFPRTEYWIADCPS